MLTARWRLPVIGAALIFGTTGGLVTSMAQAEAARPSAVRPHGPATPGGLPTGRVARARALQIGATQAAPLVTDATGTAEARRELASPKMSPAMLLANKIKQAAAAKYLGQVSPPAAKYLVATQQAQVRNYFCGPATVAEMLAQVGVKLSQPAVARQLGTNGSGTDWSNGHGYPVPRVLNANQHTTKYVAVGLPWSPTSTQITAFTTDLVADISKGAGVPIAGNAYEVPGGPHLVGHPAGQEIMHWFDIRGYAQSGAVTAYEDSVHGAGSIAWNGSVPAYSTLPTSTVVDILGARGYVW